MWGKVFGAAIGFVLGRFPGLIFGIALGHMFDRSLARQFDRAGGFSAIFGQPQVSDQAFYFYALFSVMGHIAKARGRVSPRQIQAAAALMNQMQLGSEARHEAQAAFREGKDPAFPLKRTLAEFHHACAGRHDVLQVYLEVQIQVAFAEGPLDAAQRTLLTDVALQLGFDAQSLAQLLTMIEAEMAFRRHQSKSEQTHAASSHHGALREAYRLLGVTKAADDTAVKKAYRKLMSQHHPDKLVAKGVPEEVMHLAKQKTQDIQAAYELIRSHRKSHS
ncbi:co-chaperone DjlA [Corallincola luteus]|uniref:Co-chaperone protein DjlA n=3 Tax=Corallincola TaxID=1775176 RepID=A0A368NJY3_9GAMM|nr:co-chaperone DjlA [Corallincola holothuriorum]TAA45228.1 co-chaperone DjlA [Corallincola spongiicola]TCI03788.1 co-chaperone DjlA [Corallincola luteus]